MPDKMRDLVVKEIENKDHEMAAIEAEHKRLTEEFKKIQAQRDELLYLLEKHDTQKDETDK